MQSLKEILAGHSEAHVVLWKESGRKVHKEMCESLERLTIAAGNAGFDLQVASGYRSFSRQLEIWNKKVSGELKVLDDKGHPLVQAHQTPGKLLSYVLRWLALPGSSRHHWGTDIDVYDKAALADGETLQLTIEESDSKFKQFHLWLDENMMPYRFFRPYDRDLGGVNREPWHLSYAPVSRKYFEQYSFELLRDTIAEAEIELKDEIEKNLPEIYKRFVRNICQPK